MGVAAACVSVGGLELVNGQAGVGGNASSSKTKKIMYDLAENDDFDREEIATYEEVARLFPRPAAFRPIVLIGPPGVGRNELKRRLMALDTDRYKATVPRKATIYSHYIYYLKLFSCFLDKVSTDAFFVLQLLCRQALFFVLTLL